MLVTFVVLLLTGDVVLSQYITHPLGAISYNHFHQPVVSYIAPSGQAVNIKYQTSASIKPNSDVHSAPSFVFHSAPQQPQYSFYQPQFFQHNFRAVRPELPSPESLFLPSNGVGPAHTRKQFQAYKDYLKEAAEEDAKAQQREDESLSYDFGEK